MMKRVRKIFSRTAFSGADLQLEQLRDDLQQDPSEFPLSDLRPALIPSPILATGNWIGPFHYFPELPVSLTWVVLRPNETMIYLTDNAAAALEARGIDWRAAARDALVKDFLTRPWTYEFSGALGEAEGVALIHEDGLGPTRLLCSRRLLEHFLDGFTFYIPERSVAVVLGTNASAYVRASIDQFVAESFGHADVPMSTFGFGHQTLLTALDAVGEGHP
jgi:hypothetical protein